MRSFEHLAALSLSIAPAPADGQDALLRWNAPPSCPSRAEVEAAIAANLGRPIGAADAGALAATATVEPTAEGRWSLRLSLEPHGAPPALRVAVADDCTLLAETAALMVAVAIDPERATRHPLASAPRSRLPADVPLEPDVAPVEPPLAVDNGATAPAPPSAATSRAPSPPRSPNHPTTPTRNSAPRRPLRAALAAGPVLDVGALPRPAPGLAVRLALLTRARIELGVLHLFERPARIDSERGGDLRLTAAQLVACPRLLRRRLELPLCAGFELGAMRGEGVGLPVRTRDRVAWFAFLLDGRLLWAPIPRLAFGGQLGLATPLLAARFRIAGLAGDLHRAAPIAFRAALTVELRFP